MTGFAPQSRRSCGAVANRAVAPRASWDSWRIALGRITVLGQLLKASATWPAPRVGEPAPAPGVQR